MSDEGSYDTKGEKGGMQPFQMSQSFEYQQSATKIAKLEKKIKLLSFALVVVFLWLIVSSFSGKESKTQKVENKQVQIDHYIPTSQQTKTLGESSIGTVCSTTILSGWSQAAKANRKEFKGMAIEKMPYPKLNLILNQANKHTSLYHFHEALLFFNTFKVEKPIYIHSGPEELLLIIGAVTKNDVRLIVSSSYPEKDILLTNFVINNIYSKIREEASGQSAKNIKEAEFIITTDSQVFKKYEKQQKVILYVEKDRPAPGGDIFKFESEGFCSNLQLTEFKPATLSKGLYISGF